LRKKDPSYGWLNVGSYHFSGKPVPDGWRDELGTSNTGYYKNIETWWKQLDQLAGNRWNNYTAPSSQPSNSSFNVAAIFGGSPPRISQEFGKTAFSQSTKGQSMYGYVGGLGVQGHAGIDYSMNPGSKLYVPVSGTVITTGGRPYYTDSRYGTRPGTGELRIKLDNGDELILGHMQSINLKVGQRVTPGTLAGLSGTNNGGHVHVEYRQYAPGKTSRGYLALDPRKMLVGGSVPLKSSTAEEKSSYTVGSGLAAARQAALSGSTADLARLVYNPEFLKTVLQKRMAA
jgi:murein DD-endopeptidase MepM/ murein hydrolase activator NlpD